LADAPGRTQEEILIQEVDEAVQQDRLLSFWQRYGKPLVGAIIAALVLWAGWLFWDAQQDKKAGETGEDLTQIVETLSAGGNLGAEAKLAQIAKSGNGGYPVVAKLIAAGANTQSGKVKEAIAAYQAVAKDEANPQLFRDLALIRQTAMEFDTLKPQQVLERLKPLAVETNPWFGSAAEMVAVSYERSNQPALAGKLFAQISASEDVPETLRARSAEKANSLGVAASAPSAKEGSQ
jgi:hypothetical protein